MRNQQVSGFPRDPRKPLMLSMLVAGHAHVGDSYIAWAPDIDSLQEFRIHTNSYDAPYSSTGSAMVNKTFRRSKRSFWEWYTS